MPCPKKFLVSLFWLKNRAITSLNAQLSYEESIYNIEIGGTKTEQQANTTLLLWCWCLPALPVTISVRAHVCRPLLLVVRQYSTTVLPPCESAGTFARQPQPETIIHRQLEMLGNGFLHSHSLPFPCNRFPFLPIPIPEHSIDAAYRPMPTIFGLGKTQA